VRYCCFDNQINKKTKVTFLLIFYHQSLGNVNRLTFIAFELTSFKGLILANERGLSVLQAPLQITDEPIALN